VCLHGREKKRDVALVSAKRGHPECYYYDKKAAHFFFSSLRFRREDPQVIEQVKKKRRKRHGSERRWAGVDEGKRLSFFQFYSGTVRGQKAGTRSQMKKGKMRASIMLRNEGERGDSPPHTLKTSPGE